MNGPLLARIPLNHSLVDFWPGIKTYSVGRKPIPGRFQINIKAPHLQSPGRDIPEEKNLLTLNKKLAYTWAGRTNDPRLFFHSSFLFPGRFLGQTQATIRPKNLPVPKTTSKIALGFAYFSGPNAKGAHQ